MRGWIVGVDRGLHWTRREQVVLNGVLAGRSQRDIAEALGLSVATVDATLRAMRRYARASTTAELVRIAVEQVVGMV
jgi:two-component system nitrate/nitrite response regulator NarL